MTTAEWIQIGTGALSSFCFALLFNIRGRKLLFVALGGLLSWLVFVLLKFATNSETIRYFLVVAFAGGLWPMTFARFSRLRVPALDRFGDRVASLLGRKREEQK